MLNSHLEIFSVTHFRLRNSHCNLQHSVVTSSRFQAYQGAVIDKYYIHIFTNTITSNCRLSVCGRCFVQTNLVANSRHRIIIWNSEMTTEILVKIDKKGLMTSTSIARPVPTVLMIHESFPKGTIKATRARTERKTVIWVQMGRSHL